MNLSSDLQESVDALTPTRVLWLHAREKSEDVALIAPSVQGGEARMRWGEFNAAVEGFARALWIDHAVRPGEHVALIINNACAAEGLVVFLALLRLNAVGVMVSARSALEECAQTIELTNCVVVVYGPESQHLAAVAAESVRVRAVLRLGRPDALGTSQLAPSSGPLVPRVSISPEPSVVGQIIMTSGTTGRPKAVMLTQRAILCTGIAMSRGIGIIASDVVQTAIPITSSGGCNVTFMSALVSGAGIVVEPSFDAEAMLATVVRERTTVYIGVPAMYSFLADVKVPATVGASPLRLMDFGAAPMPVQLIQRLQRAFPGVGLAQNYGMTESGPVGTYLSADDLPRKLGSIGKPVLCEIRIDCGDEREARPFEHGEILLRGPGLMDGYYRDEIATSQTIVDGWLRTGDVGYLDDEGFVYHVDRRKDVIIRGGYNVSSLEVEAALLRCEGVRDAAVVGVPHERLGEDLYAFVVMRDDQPLDADNIRSALSGFIADYKVPRTYAAIDAIPRNVVGKTLKAALRERARTLVIKERNDDDTGD